MSHNRETLPTKKRPCRQPKTWAAEESGGEGLYAGGRNRRGGWPTTHQSVREPGTLFFFPRPPSIREETPSSQGNSVVKRWWGGWRLKRGPGERLWFPEGGFSNFFTFAVRKIINLRELWVFRVLKTCRTCYSFLDSSFILLNSAWRKTAAKGWGTLAVVTVMTTLLSCLECLICLPLGCGVSMKVRWSW